MDPERGPPDVPLAPGLVPRDLDYVCIRGAILLDATFQHESYEIKHWLPYIHGYLLFLAKQHGQNIYPGDGIGIVTVFAEANKYFKHD